MGFATLHPSYAVAYRHNANVHALDKSCGFVEEGVGRESRLLSDGRRVDTITMSILRREWEELV